MQYCSGQRLHTSSTGGFLLTPCRSHQGWRALSLGAQQHSGVALQHLLHNHQQMPCTPNALQPPKLCCRLVFLSLVSFQLAPALQGSNPLCRGQPGWNAEMDARRCIFLSEVLWCAQVDSMSKAKHKSSSGLSGVSILPEAEPAYPKRCSNGKDQTNKEPNKAFINRQSGAAQERNTSLISILGMLAISSVTGEICQPLILL